MFRILFCVSVQCSAVPLLSISTLCFSFSTFIRAYPFRCVRLLSFLCLCYPLRSRTLLFRVNSSLFDSLPWRLSWNRICTYLFRFRSGPSDSVSRVVIHILAIHFLHKAALCSSVSVSLHVRSNPYQINAFPFLFASMPVNSPPFQFISTQNTSSPSVSISVLLHIIPYLVVPLPFQICSFLDLAPLLLFYVLSFCYPAHCFSVPLHFCVILLLFDSLSCFSISPLLGSSHCHSIACHISSFSCLIRSFHLLAVRFAAFLHFSFAALFTI